MVFFDDRPAAENRLKTTFPPSPEILRFRLDDKVQNHFISRSSLKGPELTTHPRVKVLQSPSGYPLG
jgi:hypothetical protein